MSKPKHHNLKTVQPRHIAIAGAGIVGRLFAWALVQCGFKVSIFDSDTLNAETACAFTAAGLITPHAEIAQLSPAITAWGKQTLALWPNIIKSLNAEIYYKADGLFILAHPQDYPEAQRIERLCNKLLKNDPNIPAQWLNQQELAKLEPELATKFSKAFYFSQEAHIQPHSILKALQQRLLEANVSWYQSIPIHSLTPYHLHTAYEKLKFDWVVDCRGIGAKEYWPDLRGIRGETMLVHAPMVQLQHPFILEHPRHGIYCVPHGEQKYLIGGSVIEAEDYSPVSVRTCLNLLSSLYSVLPQFAEARIIALRSNCRPAFDDHLPRVENKPGITRINGLYRNGYLLSPVLVAESMNEILTHLGSTSYDHRLFEW